MTGAPDPVTAAPTAVMLRTEGRIDPIGLDEPQPRLSWRLDLAPPAIEQVACTVEVATDPGFSPAGVVWSAEVQGVESAVVYRGSPPGSREQRWWRVRVTDDRGRIGPWSAPASWETGLLMLDDWVARWIGWIDPAMPSWSARSPILRRSFRLPRPVARARAYLTALGLVELTINGQPVGSDRMAPGWTDYRRRIQYRTADVADLLRAGENVVAARLGRGWYAGEVAAFGAEQYGDHPALLAQIEVTHAGGRRTTLPTDATWRAQSGPLVADDLLMGETIDARDEPAGWDRPGFREDGWQPVTVCAGPGGRLVAARNPGVAPFADLPPVTVTRDEAGRQTVDFGQNLAGHVRIRAAAPGGTTMTIRHGEALDDQGRLYTANLRGARQTDAYTFRGDGDEVFEPRFTTHGFRYAEIDGLAHALDAGHVTARAVSSMSTTIGSFACSDELVNAIHRNVLWGLRGGLVGLPTDCPQRDERLGWTADAAAMAPSALFLGDTAALFESWLVDLADAQLPSGAYPDVAPRIGVTGSGNAGWADAGVQIPWAVYRATGNLGVVERQYESMRRYLQFLEADQVGGLRHGGRYGDWLALEGPTSFELIGTAYLAHAAALFVRMARLLQRADDAERFGKLEKRATAAFRRRFLTADGTLVRETQTGYALALGFGLVPPARRAIAADRLARLIEAADGHLLTGFLGTALALPALSEHGYHALATAVVRRDTFPGWGFEVRQGATTIWERWDSWTPERGFADPGMNSLNHAALGSVAAWLHEHLAGLAPGAPGYRTMVVRPGPAAGIDRAQAAHESAHGRHAVEWQVAGPSHEVRLEIPPGTFAEVVVPRDARSLWVDGARARIGTGAVVHIAASGRDRRVRLSWGTHVVVVER